MGSVIGCFGKLAPMIVGVPMSGTTIEVEMDAESNKGYGRHLWL
jgi:hypothetical protein